MGANPNKVSWIRRLVVDGDSMAPALLPGDRVVALRLGARRGDVAAVRDPRVPARIVVKRVVEIGDDGSLVVAGDNAAASTDSRHFGPVPRELVVGRVVYRYAPASRVGWFRRGRAWRRRR